MTQRQSISEGCSSPSVSLAAPLTCWTWVMTQDMELHYCNRRTTLTQHFVNMTSCYGDIFSSNFKSLFHISVVHFLITHFFLSIIFLPCLAFQFQLQSLQPTSALSTLRLHARVFFLYPLKYLNVLSLFIWLPDMKQYMNSFSLSALLCFVLVLPRQRL